MRGQPPLPDRTLAACACALPEDSAPAEHGFHGMNSMQSVNGSSREGSGPGLLSSGK